MLFVSFNSRRMHGISVVIDDLVGHKHAERSKVAGVDALSDEATDETFIGVRCRTLS